MIDFTHDPLALSWVDSANDPESDFPLQNLPLGRFRLSPHEQWRVGVAIGDRVLDLQLAVPGSSTEMRHWIGLPKARRTAIRHALWRGLVHKSPQTAAWRKALYAQSDVELGLPCEVGDYTDFYTGIHHAWAVGKLMRPDAPLTPNYKWLPIGYHGRASSIIASGEPVSRPKGQLMPPGADKPFLAPTKRMDYELELGVWIGPGNTLGESIAVDRAEDHIAGLTLLNDWSARDIQAWEYQPLGPFLAKNFATTVSPWLVSPDALEPFRSKLQRPDGDPAPLSYLQGVQGMSTGMWDLQLEVWIQSPAMLRAARPAHCLSRSRMTDAYWTLSQLVAHHTVNGCNLRSGDLLSSGTLSGPQSNQGGSLLELSAGGKQLVDLGHGESRAFLLDGDTIFLRAFAQRDGARRIGFGPCSGTVLAARP